ncbi:hypothetical protein BCV70DRAFT_5624 [Testicularia cyperi]|uniref:Uncharacterized protein n=1 Tax=Testicularia cyperi TaxID=1882483 RepID=A0A317XXX8_9BASI|nr:hypothetical protein BCV70DRAFT_5624 [Testicularia cyperi]
MQSAGGFIIDDPASVLALEHRAQPEDRHIQTEPEVHDTLATPKPLSAKQEAKLRSFLDETLDNLSRGYRKRFDSSSTLRTLPLYLEEWRRILGVLGRIPPYGSGGTNLLLSYLLRCSTDLCEGIAGYGLGMEIEERRRTSRRVKSSAATPATQEMAPDSSSADNVGPQSDNQQLEEDAEQDEDDDLMHETISSRNSQLNSVLQTLDLLDRVWTSILRGNMINFPVASANARLAFAEVTEGAHEGTSRSSNAAPYRARFEATTGPRHSTSSLVPSPAIDGRFVPGYPVLTASSVRESVPIHGGRGNRTVGVTDQVRLRNIAISSREKLFAWMRSELDAPSPPTMDDGDERKEAEPEEPADNTIKGMFSSKKGPAGTQLADAVENEDENGDEDPEMEDVDIDEHPDISEEGYDPKQDTDEHRHYQDLFDRKIDPDAEDEDEDEDEKDQHQTPSSPLRDNASVGQDLGASVAGMVNGVRGDDHPSKRKRDDAEDEEHVDEVMNASSSSKRIRSDSEDGAGTEHVRMSRSEVGSLEFSMADAIGQWDLAFTRLFSRTLRTLSDLAEFSHKGGNQAGRSVPNYTTGLSAAANVGNDAEDDLAE